MKKLYSLLLLTGALLALPFAVAQAEPLAAGADAPALKAVNQDGEEVDLEAQFKEGVTLVYFYPKADTPGCTKQACNLRDSFEKVSDEGITVIGVSADGPEAQKAFKDKYDLPFVLIADSDLAVTKAFGVPLIRESLSSRQSFLIKDGKIIWADYKAKPDTQAEDAIAAAKANG